MNSHNLEFYGFEIISNLQFLWKFCDFCVIIFSHGADLVSTGVFEHRWQVECPRYGHKKINAKNLKNAVANMFGIRQAVAFA